MGKALDKMEASLFLRIQDLRDIRGDKLDENVIDALSSIYRAGWLDCLALYSNGIEAAFDMLDALTDIDESCQQGLNSESAIHWQAALQDIMSLARPAIAKAKGQ